MYQIHPNARTTPAVRATIASSAEPSGVLAKLYSRPKGWAACHRRY
ncbi:Transposase [Azospirillum endophyticum]